jgi:DNA polymerase-3 subunit gamma/tau
LIGIASAERLVGLVRRLVARDARSALAELDEIIQGGVEVGLLLDQLVGYFRDVMATAVGCRTDQLLYALPSQAEEVAQFGKQLGLATVLAIGQILDHTAARLRVSMHGRTLVEMAVVRICQLDELDELSSLIAEIRGETGRESRVGATREPDAKKNVEAAAGLLLGATGSASVPQVDRQKSALAEPVAPAAATARRSDPPHVASDLPNEPADGTVEAAVVEADSVLAQWQRAMADGSQSRPANPRSRPSRREQIAQIAEQPFVKRAMELFVVPPEKMRYTPADERSSGVVE